MRVSTHLDGIKIFDEKIENKPASYFKKTYLQTQNLIEHHKARIDREPSFKTDLKSTNDQNYVSFYGHKERTNDRIKERL